MTYWSLNHCLPLIHCRRKRNTYNNMNCLKIVNLLLTINTGFLPTDVSNLGSAFSNLTKFVPQSWLLLNNSNSQSRCCAIKFVLHLDVCWPNLFPQSCECRAVLQGVLFITAVIVTDSCLVFTWNGDVTFVQLRYKDIQETW